MAVAGIELNIRVAGNLKGKLAVAGIVENNPVAGSLEGKLAVAGIVEDNPVVDSLKQELAVAGVVEDNPVALPGVGYRDTGVEQRTQDHIERRDIERVVVDVGGTVDHT